MMRLFLSSLFIIVVATTATFAAEKANIIFVLLDDMGYGQPTCYSPTSQFKTPNIDRTAREGDFREASNHQNGKKALAIRKGKWKLIVHGDSKRELFDLDADIGETRNVIDENSMVASTLDQLLQSYLTNGRSTLGPAQPLEHKISLDKARYKKK